MTASTNYRNEIRKRTVRGAPQVGTHHGEGPSDGAQRNAIIAAMSAQRKEQNRSDKEKKIADRTADAEKRKKETLAMATEETQTHIFHAHIKPMRKSDAATKVVLKVKASNRNEATNKVSKHLAKNYGVSNVSSVVHKGIMEETGTEARTKIKNVARPNDADPTSEKSLLSKNGEIKVKKVDEEIAADISRKYGLTDSLIAATRAIMEKKHDDDMKSIGKSKTEVDTKPTTNDQVNDGDDSPNAKKKSKKLDNVGKEDDDIDNDGDVDKSDKYLHARRKAIKKAVKEEAENLDEAIKIGSRVKIHAPGKDYHGVVGNVGEIDHGLHNKSIKRYTVDYDNRSKSITVPKPQLKLHTEEAEQIDELKKSTLGSYVTKVAKLAPDQVKPSRREGIVKASQKLRKMDREDTGMNEEVEQIDELKKSTLASYTKKASNDATKHSYMAGKTGDVDTAAKASKRIRGINMATNKLAKEEFSDDELARLEEIAAKFERA